MIPDKWITKDENGKEIVDAVWFFCPVCKSLIHTLRANLKDVDEHTYNYDCPACKEPRGIPKSKVHRVK